MVDPSRVSDHCSELQIVHCVCLGEVSYTATREQLAYFKVGLALKGLLIPQRLDNGGEAPHMADRTSACHDDSLTDDLYFSAG